MPLPSPPEDVARGVPSAQPEAPKDIATQLLNEEVADLEAQASVTTFIGVIAARRVKERLRKLKTK